jgi:integrase/recombinase XerD
MLTVTLKPLQHRNTTCIGIYFTHNRQLSVSLKKIKGIKWSSTNKCWYLPLSKENYNLLSAAVGSQCQINTAALKNYLTKKQTAIKIITAANKKVVVAVTKQPVAANNLLQNISTNNLQALAVFVQQLQLKSYSPSTIRTYKNEFSQLLQTIKKTEVQNLTADDLKRYMVFAMEKQHISDNTAHSRLNALKFYFEQVLHREKFFWEIPRPKKPLQLPNVLGEKDLARLFNALNNKKHKAILFTAYSAGLRVSEAVSLKLTDIDSDRMTIKVENAKGKKDRQVNLSPVLLDVLREYVKKSVPRPKTYLFESEVPGEAYAVRSAQRIFQRAKELAGIRKEVSFHSLRHSFATHLMEKGIDIRYIKDILGHFDIKTTERYAHVSKSKLITITSPLDDLWLKGDIL